MHRCKSKRHCNVCRTHKPSDFNYIVTQTKNNFYTVFLTAAKTKTHAQQQHMQQQMKVSNRVERRTVCAAGGDQQKTHTTPSSVGNFLFCLLLCYATHMQHFRCVSVSAKKPFANAPLNRQKKQYIHKNITTSTGIVSDCQQQQDKRHIVCRSFFPL